MACSLDLHTCDKLVPFLVNYINNRQPSWVLNYSAETVLCVIQNAKKTKTNNVPSVLTFSCNYSPKIRR